jgi:hypothetical protein
VASGFCTTDDVRRVFQEAEFTGALNDANRQIVVDAITGQSDWIERATKKFWYDSGGISEDDENVIASTVESRDDEHDIPTHGGYVVGAYDDSARQATDTTGTVFHSHTDQPDPKEEIKLAGGDLTDDTIPTYFQIELARRDVQTITKLEVLNENGAWDDWAASSNYAGGVGRTNRGDDYWVRENNTGDTVLYIDVHSLDDDIPAFSNAVYVDFEYGEDGIPSGVRRGVALYTAAELVTDDEFQTSIPDQGQLVNVETKSERWERRGREKLEPYIVEPM